MSIIATHRPSDAIRAMPDERAEYLRLLHTYMARYPIITEFQLYDCTNLDKLCYFLSQSNNLLTSHQPPAAEIITLNPLPALHAYAPDDITPLYIHALDRPTQVAALYHYHAGHDNDSDVALMALANAILQAISAPQLIYQITDFDIGLYLMIPPAKARLLGLSGASDDSTELVSGLSTDSPPLVSSLPYDLSQVYTSDDMQFMLSHAPMYDIAAKGSLSADDAYQWLLRQKGRILAWTYTALPDALMDWQALDPIPRFRKLYNLFIALARHSIADARLVDERYKRYPLMTQHAYHNIIAHLVDEPNVEKNVIDFFFDDNILALWLLPNHEDDGVRLHLTT